MHIMIFNMKPGGAEEKVARHAGSKNRELQSMHIIYIDTLALWDG